MRSKHISENQRMKKYLRRIRKKRDNGINKVQIEFLFYICNLGTFWLVQILFYTRNLGTFRTNMR
jgi:hypothetical protein